MLLIDCGLVGANDLIDSHKEWGSFYKSLGKQLDWCEKYDFFFDLFNNCESERTLERYLDENYNIKRLQFDFKELKLSSNIFKDLCEDIKEFTEKQEVKENLKDKQDKEK